MKRSFRGTLLSTALAWLSLTAPLWTSALAQNSTPAHPQLQATLEALRQRHQVPALGGALVSSRGLVAVGAVGIRKVGSPVRVTVEDKWHLGSNAKAMTATLMGALVERGRLQWTTTLAQAFPEWAPGMPPALRNVTLLHLLSHRAGFGANLPWAQLPRRETIHQQRLDAVRLALSSRLEAAPGERFIYSNTGYVVAATMAEVATDLSWEDLMKQVVFEPLAMSSVGYGGLGTPGQLDQPWPHSAQGLPMPLNGPELDNPPVLGPAGRVHCTLADWAKFVADQLRGLRGGRALLRQESYRRLFTAPFGGEYTLGWIRAASEVSNGTIFTHSGDNTMNHATVWFVPARDYAVLVTTNQSGVNRTDPASAVCEEAIPLLSRLHTGLP